MFQSNSKSHGTGSARRRFLRSTLASFGAFFALATTERTYAAQADLIESSQKPETKGYQETDHVRRYYDTARM